MNIIVVKKVREDMDHIDGIVYNFFFSFSLFSCRFQMVLYVDVLLTLWIYHQ